MQSFCGDTIYILSLQSIKEDGGGQEVVPLLL
jgi:hypothetical protein